MTDQTSDGTFLRNAWYIAALPGEITARPLARLILGEPIVLYRTTDGVCVALADRCCHRGVPLHLGTVVDDCIQCAYHGFTFDRSGKCVRVPSQKSPPPAARVSAYSLLERHGFVWIWMGTATSRADTIPDLGHLESAGWTSMSGVLPIQADYRRVIDNILDLSHVSFVHRSTFGSDDALADLRFKEVAGRVEGVRTGPPMPTPPLYRRLGFSAQIHQTKRMIYEVPCHVKAPIETVDYSGKEVNPHSPRSATVYVFNSLTPETPTSCHYFWTSSRNFDLANAQVTELIREQTLEAFREDQLIVEAEQRSHAEGFRGGTAVHADVGGAMARRLLSRRITQESNREEPLPSPRAEGADV